MIELLPKWILTGNRPSFYDGESVTVIELASKLHGTMNELITDYNAFSERVNAQITEFMSGTKKDLETFEVSLRQEFQDFIDVINVKYLMQEEIFKETVGSYNSIKELVTEAENNLKIAYERMITDLSQVGNITNELGDSEALVLSQAGAKNNLVNQVKSPNSFRRVYGVTTSGEQEMVVAYAGNKATNIAVFTTQSSSIGGKNYNNGVLITDVPTKPYQCANKKYVDEEIAPLLDQLGSYTFTVTRESNNPDIAIPEGAQPVFYVKNTYFKAKNEDGSIAYEGNANYIYFYDLTGNLIGGVEITEPGFVTMPEGTFYFHFNAGDIASDSGNWDATSIEGSFELIFCVKVEVI